MNFPKFVNFIGKFIQQLYIFSKNILQVIDIERVS